ncbi:hypothetical protein RIF29_25307 [Crotalaria pallida]|uniref:Ethylene insensitive 3-like DNA-binding domain-containing protein n=1 Tax=Crotalaria pallida TaxID=3830 RepID=A0AAN9ELC5_CROPI
MIGCSDNLRECWKGNIKFDCIGPAAIDKYEQEKGMDGYSIMEGNNSDKLQPQFPMNENVQDINYVVIPSNGTANSNKRKREHDDLFGFNDRNVRKNHQHTCVKHPKNHAVMIGGSKDQFENNNKSILSHRESSHIVAPFMNQTAPLPMVVSESGFAIPENGEEMVVVTTPTRSNATLTSFEQNIIDSVLMILLHLAIHLLTLQYWMTCPHGNIIKKLFVLKLLLCQHALPLVSKKLYLLFFMYASYDLKHFY